MTKVSLKVDNVVDYNDEFKKALTLIVVSVIEDCTIDDLFDEDEIMEWAENNGFKKV